MIYTPIKINDRQYYFRNVYAGEYSDYSYTQFYEKGENITVCTKKRKYWLFGPVISTTYTQKENYKPVFFTNHKIAEGSFFDIEAIKKREEKYFAWKSIEMGNLEL